MNTSIARLRIAGWIAVALTCLTSPALAQKSSGASIPRATGGAILGGAAGLVVGGFAGGAFTSRNCESGNPDACIGPTFLGIIWGGGVGLKVLPRKRGQIALAVIYALVALNITAECWGALTRDTVRGSSS